MGGRRPLCQARAVVRLFLRLRDLVLQMTGLVIAAELAQRRLVELKQDLAQCRGSRITGGETDPVDLAQRADQGVAVLVTDFTVLVAVAIVESRLAHAALPSLCS